MQIFLTITLFGLTSRKIDFLEIDLKCYERVCLPMFIQLGYAFLETDCNFRYSGFEVDFLFGNIAYECRLAIDSGYPTTASCLLELYN